MGTLSPASFLIACGLVLGGYLKLLGPRVTPLDVASVMMGMLVGHSIEGLRSAWRADHPRGRQEGPPPVTGQG